MRRVLCRGKAKQEERAWHAATAGDDGMGLHREDGTRVLSLDPASTSPKVCLGRSALDSISTPRWSGLFHDRLVQREGACHSRTARNWPAEACPLPGLRCTPSFS